MQSLAAAASARYVSGQIDVQTTYAREFIDITDRVLSIAARAGVSDGLALVQSQHTTASIVVNEHEPELLRDLDDMLQTLAPEDKHYYHNAVPCGPGERENGHAHCQALLLNASVVVPLAEGSLVLGRYQRIFLVELDHARSRRVSVTILGA